MFIQSVDLWVLAPTIALAVGAVVALLADLMVSRRSWIVGWAALLAVVVSAAFLWQSNDSETMCTETGCAYVVDSLTLAIQIVTLVGVAVVILLSTLSVEDLRIPAGEYYFLLLCSASGAMLVPATTDLVTLIVAIEVATLPTFALVALNRADARASEGALKAFLYSVASVAVSLYGVALIYGSTGTLSLGPLSVIATEADPSPLAATGLVLLLAVAAFKVAAVPFHAWAPDAYESAPVPVAAFLSVVSKAVGFAAFIQILSTFAAWNQVWAPVMAGMAVLSMAIANVAALRQTGVVRLLAWSSIAQAGYILVPFAAIVAGFEGAAALLPAVIGYLVGYAALNLGAFGVVTVAGRGQPGITVEQMSGLAWRSPWQGFALAFFLAGLAGLPPGLIGLFIKIQVIAVPVGTGAWLVTATMVIAIVIGLAYYLRFAAALFRRGSESAPSANGRGGLVSAGPANVAIGAMLVVTVVLSLAPTSALGLLDRL